MSTPECHGCDMAKTLNGKSLRNAREAAGLTREQLALKAGTSTSTIARIELDGHIPSGVTLIGISDALDITLDSLLVAA